MSLSLEQLRCLSSPVRADVISLMRFHRGVSVSELATEMGVSSEALHYHARALVAAGLLRKVGQRRSGKRNEEVYDLVAESYTFDPLLGNRDYRDQTRLAVRRILRMAEDEYEEASRHADTVAELRPLLFAQRFNSRLTDETARELKRRLREVLDWARSEDDPIHGRRFAGVASLAPVLSKSTQKVT